jgi:hypothetical protein
MFCAPWLGIPFEPAGCYAGPDKGQVPWDHKNVGEYYSDHTILFVDALLMGWTVSAAYVLYPLFQDIYADRGWKGLKKPLLLFMSVVIITGWEVCRI